MSIFDTTFNHIQDPRANINIKHELLDIIFITFAGIMSGAEGWSDIQEFAHTKQDWLRQHRSLKSGIPSEDTIARVIKAIEPKALNASFIAWVNQVRQHKDMPQIAIDGKTLKHSRDGEKYNALHSISAWCQSSGLVLSHIKSDGKKNEHAGVLDTLELLNIKSCVITVDAMNSQKKIAEKIIEKEADYIFCIKDNHKHFRQEIESYFHKVKRDEATQILFTQQHDAGHGRIEIRTCEVLAINHQWIEQAKEWKNINQIIRLERTRIDKATGVSCIDEQYYISSLQATSEQYLHYIRQHWGIENQVHWVLDVVYKEDDSFIRKGDGAENVATIRRFCLNIAKLHSSKISMKAKVKKAGWDDGFRDELLFGAKLI
ncbi:ISAs1 family transposase [Moraxella sp. ZY21109]|uniref:ISAs1 family transposase n=1 Tax=Moraxella sp. ZY21109 TaxID=2911969 RepID=UPI003D7D05A9